MQGEANHTWHQRGVFPALRAIPPPGGLNSPRPRQQHEVGSARSCNRLFDTDRFDGAAALAQTGRVGNPHLSSVKIKNDFYEIARRSRFIRHNSCIPLRQGIQETRLSGVGRTENDHVEAIADDFCSAEASNMASYLDAHPVDVGPNLICDRTRNVRLVGKIHLSFDHGACMNEAPAPAGVKLFVSAMRIKDRKATLCFGLGADQVGKCFSLQEINLAVKKCSSGELTSFGRANAFYRTQRIQERRDNCLAAVSVQFSGVLAGETGRRLKKQRYSEIDMSACLIGENPIASKARFRNRARNRFECRSSLGSAYAHHGDAGR